MPPRSRSQAKAVARATRSSTSAAAAQAAAPAPAPRASAGGKKVKKEATEQDVLRSAKVLQRVWRLKFKWLQTRYLLEDNAVRGATPAFARRVSFDTLVAHVREKEVIRVAKAAFQRIHHLCTLRHGSPQNSPSPEDVNVRVLLAGLMIAYRPTHVFESMGSLEKALLEVAAPFFAQFSAICASVRLHGHFDKVPTEKTKDFGTMLFEYLRRFKAWKVPDEAKLVARIKHALMALYQGKAHLPPDEPQDSKLQIEFDTQIMLLRGKLQQIGGQPALDDFDAKRLAAGVTDEAHGPLCPYHRGGGGGAYAALPGRMSNRQLAHELLYDPAFQLGDDAVCGVENPMIERIRESFHKVRP